MAALSGQVLTEGGSDCGQCCCVVRRVGGRQVQVQGLWVEGRQVQVQGGRVERLQEQV